MKNIYNLLIVTAIIIVVFGFCSCKGKEQPKEVSKDSITLNLDTDHCDVDTMVMRRADIANGD